MKANDSDNDEGFVPTKVQINSDHKQNKNSKNQNHHERPTDFQARYIFGDRLLKKQPAQIYARFLHYLKDESCIQLQSKQQNKKQSLKNFQNPGKLQHSPDNQMDHSLKQENVKQQKTIKQQITNTNENANTNANTKEINLLANQSHLNNNNPDPSLDNQITLSVNRKKMDPSCHPYEKFIKSQSYVLVYSRYRDKNCLISPDSDEFSSNEVSLNQVLSKYDADHYNVLKNFQPANFIKHLTHLQQNNPSFKSTDKQSTQHSSLRVQSQSNNHDNHHSLNSISHSSTHSKQPELQFDSKFQSGNLLYVFKDKLQSNTYYLFTQNDTNSYGYNQWFYFSIRNMKKNKNYKFTIVNLRKRHSLFKQGMKISVWSYLQSQQPQNHGNGWKKTGSNIKYEKSIIKKNKDKKYKFYSLSFQLNFIYDNDYVKVAMNIPYSYSRLVHHLKICGENAKNSEIKAQQINNRDRVRNTNRKYSNKYRNINSLLKQDRNDHLDNLSWELKPIGYSLSNNAVPYITLTNIKNVEQKSQVDQSNLIQQSIQGSINTTKQKKKAVIILARQHPGQTWSSFLMQQILYSLTENKTEATKWLLKNYVFKIFPMVNVDGVIYGNFRCDLGGFDLNRNWRMPDKSLHPQVFAIKTEIQRISSQFSVQCVFDLHGHSKQYNTFSYSCKNDSVTSRVLSLMMSEINPIFHFPYCTFGLSKYKQTTARAAIYRLTGLQNILTIQNSFHGAKIGQTLLQYDPKTMNIISHTMIQALYEYLANHPHRKQCQNKIRLNLEQYERYENSFEGPVADSGSESQPYADQISIKQKLKKILPKAFKQIAYQLEEEQKKMKKRPPVKKRQTEKKSVSANQNYQTVNTNKLQKTIKVTEENQSDTQTFIQRTSLTYYKRTSRQLPKKQADESVIIAGGADSVKVKQEKNTIQSDSIMKKTKYGEIGLPFYLREKSTLVPIKLKNDSLEIFKDAYNATKNDQQKSNKFASKGSKKLKILSSKNQSSEEFPALCVFSEEKKRQTQLKKNYVTLNQKQITVGNKISSSLHPKMKTFVQNQKLQHLMKTQRQKNQSFTNNKDMNRNTPGTTNGQGSNQSRGSGNTDSHNTGIELAYQRMREKSKDATLISKIWRQNFARYGKDLNIFFGGLKGV